VEKLSRNPERHGDSEVRLSVPRVESRIQ
jgi:hypothetical protein